MPFVPTLKQFSPQLGKETSASLSTVLNPQSWWLLPRIQEEFWPFEYISLCQGCVTPETLGHPHKIWGKKQAKTADMKQEAHSSESCLSPGQGLGIAFWLKRGVVQRQIKDCV